MSYRSGIWKGRTLTRKTSSLRQALHFAIRYLSLILSLIYSYLAIKFITIFLSATWWHDRWNIVRASHLLHWKFAKLIIMVFSNKRLLPLRSKYFPLVLRYDYYDELVISTWVSMKSFWIALVWNTKPESRWSCVNKSYYGLLLPNFSNQPTAGDQESTVTTVVFASDLGAQSNAIHGTSDNGQPSLNRTLRLGSKRLPGRCCASLNMFSVKAAESIAIAMASMHLKAADIAQAVIELSTHIRVSKSPRVLNEPTGEMDRAEMFVDQLLPESIVKNLMSNLPSMERILRLSDSPPEQSVRWITCLKLITPNLIFTLLH